MTRWKSVFSLNALAILAMVFLSSCSQKDQKTSAELTNADRVNVFLGTSGDHGQMSPSASFPFSMLSIGPITNPHNHTGYEYYAKQYLGFVHTHLEGVGCRGCGGNILVKPVWEDAQDSLLIRKSQEGSPGYYGVSFENGIEAEFTVEQNRGLHHYRFPSEKNGLLIDLSFTQPERFVAEEHHIEENKVTGWIDSKTTCSVGVYRIYYAIKVPGATTIQESAAHQLKVSGNGSNQLELEIGFSSVNTTYAEARLDGKSFAETRKETGEKWNNLLGRIQVEGEQDREDLFYSLLYRGLQAPYRISETDGVYRAIDGSIQNSDFVVYNGWAIWDNYREQLPMLSLLYPDYFGDIAKSIANLYPYGKKDWATMHEPSPTVRTEHAVVVLLDAWNKGYDVPLDEIKDQLIEAAQHFDYSTPDKALESSYDCWALSKILKIVGDTALAETYHEKALQYKNYWEKDFADLTQGDIDRMQARGLYQGTIWQYRWFVPFDVAGLKELCGGDDLFVDQLDSFFGNFSYNHANQPDLQVPGMYNATGQPWKSQKLYRELLLDTVVQCYFNDNSKGIDPVVGRIYNNRPRAYVRTMDDDAGTMSSWFVMRSLGLSPANVGDSIYYLTTPIFKTVKIGGDSKNALTIKVVNYDKDNMYIESAQLNGTPLNRNWLSQQEIQAGGVLELTTSLKPNKQWGVENSWVSKLN